MTEYRRQDETGGVMTAKRNRTEKVTGWLTKGKIAYGSLILLTIGLNVLAWNSSAFCDWYITYIFPIWLNTYGRLTGLFPFSVGEWLIVIGVVLVAVAVVLGIVWLVRGLLWAMAKLSHRGAGKCDSVRPETVASQSRKGLTMLFGRLACISRAFYSLFAWTVAVVCLIMTLNCYILYHASTFSEKYFGVDEKEYSIVDVIEIYNMVAAQCNELSKVMERDENGTVLYGGCLDEKGNLLDMQDMARKMMQQLGETYPQLDGYYSRPKALLSSDFMCQQYMCGYYFPFSLEANYNDVMYILNKPASMCHELAHLRGYIYEDEANFISYLACIQSEDNVFRYAGYLSVLVYLNNDLYAAWQKNPAAYEEAVAQLAPIAVDNQVWIDNTFVTDEEWERINGKALIETEVVEEAADTFIETNLQMNGVSDGRISYSRVVKLLLQYYNQ